MFTDTLLAACYIRDIDSSPLRKPVMLNFLLEYISPVNLMGVVMIASIACATIITHLGGK